MSTSMRAFVFKAACTRSVDNVLGEFPPDRAKQGPETHPVLRLGRLALELLRRLGVRVDRHTALGPLERLLRQLRTGTADRRVSTARPRAQRGRIYAPRGER
jgi:hypothetical protein